MDPFRRDVQDGPDECSEIAQFVQFSEGIGGAFLVDLAVRFAGQLRIAGSRERFQKNLSFVSAEAEVLFTSEEGPCYARTWSFFFFFWLDFLTDITLPATNVVQYSNLFDHHGDRRPSVVSRFVHHVHLAVQFLSSAKMALEISDEVANTWTIFSDVEMWITCPLRVNLGSREIAIIFETKHGLETKHRLETGVRLRH